MSDDKLFESIELALRGEADGTEAVDNLMDLKTAFFNLKEKIQKNCGHWYEPGYGPRYWIPDKWVEAALGYKPKSPGIEPAFKE